MVGGYAGKMVFVDLSTLEVKEEAVDDEVCRDFMGGIGFGAKILFERQKGGVDPLGPDNILGFVTGPLTGTPALFGTRHSVVAKSPSTGGWGESNSGADIGPHLKFAGYDALFIRGISDKPVYLFIEDGRVEIRDAGHLWGQDTYATMHILRSETGKRVRTACIGPAGEKLSLISGIVNDRTRAAARSGLGAVMGSKKLKAVAVVGSREVPLADAERSNELRKQHLGQLSGWIKESLQKYGTAGGTVRNVMFGISPVKNWAGSPKDFPEIERLHPDNLLPMQMKRHACYRCPIACGAVLKAGTEYSYEDETPQPEYETTTSFGAMCLNSNLESIIKANDICNRYGLDTISTGVTIAFAIDCYENGLINRRDTDGLELTWGNDRAIVALTEQMARREGFGATLADGSKVAAERIGRGAEEVAMHVHGRELPSADCRFTPSMAVTYVTGPNPGDHDAGGAEWPEMGRGVPVGVEYQPVERLAFSGKGDLHALMRKYFHIMDAVGFCLMGRYVIPFESIMQQMAAVTGCERSEDEMLTVGERIGSLCQAFNVREGLKPGDLKLPARAAGIPPLREGINANVTLPVEEMAKEFFEAMDWDWATGKPSRKRLQELGLENVAAELW